MHSASRSRATSATTNGSSNTNRVAQLVSDILNTPSSSPHHHQRKDFAKDNLKRIREIQARVQATSSSTPLRADHTLRLHSAFSSTEHQRLSRSLVPNTMRASCIRSRSADPPPSATRRSLSPSEPCRSRVSFSKAVKDDLKTTPHRLGEIPKYLKNRKKKEEKQEPKEEEQDVCNDVPQAGRVLVSEEKRLHVLHLLETRHKELLGSLAVLPVHRDTPSMRKARQEIESCLDRIEQGIAAFSKPHVFVRTDD